MTPAVEFKNVTKRFPGAAAPALDRVSLAIDPGELVCVLGTSGGGKTTFIKLINRLHDPDTGTVLVNGQDVSQVDPVELRRGIGYVIQQTGLFPHMSVAENIACVPKILKWDRGRIDARVDDLLEATAEHLMLLGATMFISCAIAALITVACLRSRPLGNAVVEVLGAAYAIPSLALFALLIPLTGLGFTSAVIVMVVYNQFMLVRNALEGIRGVDPALIEAARGMGLSDSQVLLKVQLPLALPAIIAGVRLACISTIGIATIAATINAGGLGMILLSGLRSMNIDKILAGTICCAALALALDGTLRLIEARSHLVHRDKPGAARR